MYKVLDKHERRFKGKKVGEKWIDRQTTKKFRMSMYKQ